MPENLIALEDCIVDNKGHTVLFVLPKYVMFERVEAVVDEEKYGNWHNHYPNQFGDLVVACDNVARFFAPGEVVRPYKGSYGENYLRLAFESYRTLGHWGERIYVHEHLKKANTQLPIGRVPVNIVMQIPLVKAVTQSFIDWVNEYARINGEHVLMEPYPSIFSDY